MKNNNLSYNQLYSLGCEKLKQQKLEHYPLDARILLQWCSSLNDSRFQLARDETVPTLVQGKYLNAIKRRGNHEPIAYIVGKKEFYSLDFFVTPSVLIPRPETELLVEHALTFIQEKQKEKPGETMHFLDACTGSGNISIALMHEADKLNIPLRGAAFDISESALNIAKKNRAHHRIEPLLLYRQDLFNKLAIQENSLDLFCANPPYVPYEDKPALTPDILNYEPHDALFAEDDGMKAILLLVEEACRVLRSGGRALIEISSTEQAARLLHRLQNSYFMRKNSCTVQFLDDYAGIKRFLQLTLTA